MDCSLDPGWGLLGPSHTWDGFCSSLGFAQGFVNIWLKIHEPEIAEQRMESGPVPHVYSASCPIAKLGPLRPPALP